MERFTFSETEVYLLMFIKPMTKLSPLARHRYLTEYLLYSVQLRSFQLDVVFFQYVVRSLYVRAPKIHKSMKIKKGLDKYLDD